MDRPRRRAAAAAILAVAPNRERLSRAPPMPKRRKKEKPVQPEITKEMLAKELEHQIRMAKYRLELTRKKEPSPEPSTELEEDLVLNSHPGVPEAADSLQLAKLKKALRMDGMIKYVDSLMSKEIEMPDDACPSMYKRKQPLFNIFSVDGLYTERELSFIKETNLLNTKLMSKQREWVKRIIFEDEKLDDDQEDPITEADLKTALKLHRLEKRLRKKFKKDPSKQKYRFYSAGLLSEYDSYRDHSSKFKQDYLDSLKAPPSPPPSTTMPAKSDPISPMKQSYPVSTVPYLRPPPATSRNNAIRSTLNKVNAFPLLPVSVVKPVSITKDQTSEETDNTPSKKMKQQSSHSDTQSAIITVRETLLLHNKPNNEVQLNKERSDSSSLLANLLKNNPPVDQIKPQIDRQNISQTKTQKSRIQSSGKIDPADINAVNIWLKNRKARLLKTQNSIEANKANLASTTLQVSGHPETHNHQAALVTRPVAQLNHPSDQVGQAIDRTGLRMSTHCQLQMNKSSDEGKKQADGTRSDELSFLDNLLQIYELARPIEEEHGQTTKTNDDEKVEDKDTSRQPNQQMSTKLQINESSGKDEQQIDKPSSETFSVLDHLIQSFEQTEQRHTHQQPKEVTPNILSSVQPVMVENSSRQPKQQMTTLQMLIAAPISDSEDNQS